jgi:AraC-like DNA-binding protein
MPTREKMTVHVPDRFKAANAFWIGLAKIGLTPAAVLSQARLPLTLYDGRKNLVTTAQFFALWRAVGEVSGDPAAGLKIATQIDVGNRPPSTMAAYYARDYRDALTRLARFKQLCSPEELKIKVSKDECVIEPVWLHAQEETPSLLTDAAFVSFVELGRRGTGHLVTAKRVELKRSAEATGFHEAYFKGPITFGARRNALVLHATDLDRPFLTYNAELLDMLNPQLERAFEERRAQTSISEQVKWILKRLLTGTRPEMAAVARELGMSDRTLQRRIIDDGATFRQLLLEVRQELAHEYLNRPELDVTEVAYLLGYEDSNSFYRAFRTWEGTTPSHLRAELRRSEARQ